MSDNAKSPPSGGTSRTRTIVGRVIGGVVAAAAVGVAAFGSITSAHMSKWRSATSAASTPP